MAADATLLRSAQSGAAWLRLYTWHPGCLSFGRNEPALLRYNREQISELGLDTVRRPTGGRAVWHAAEVTYAVAAPVARFGSLAQTYLAVHQLLAIAIAELGVSAAVARRPSKHHAGLFAGACFASPAGGEIVAAGRKLVGSAQVREGNAFLQHGSILLDDGQDLVRQVTRGASASPHATSISAETLREVSFAEVAEAIGETARAAWDGEWCNQNQDPAPDLLAQFSSPQWTWRR